MLMKERRKMENKGPQCSGFSENGDFFKKILFNYV